MLWYTANHVRSLDHEAVGHSTTAATTACNQLVLDKGNAAMLMFVMYGMPCVV
jgi:hypothetical protein